MRAVRCVLRAIGYVPYGDVLERLERLSWFVLPPKRTSHGANDGGRGASLA